VAEQGARRFRRGSIRKRPSSEGVWYPRWFWPSFAVPATAWILVLFLLPFYAILSVAFGTTDPIFGTASPIWNPLHWHFSSFLYVANQTFFIGGTYRPAFIRTLTYVVVAVGASLLIGYPVAYFISRYGGRYKALLLVGLIAPFWISYLMRMLAWVNLLQDDGLVNQALSKLHVIGSPISWLDARAYTVVLGLIYGYIPYMILPLFGGLDRIDRSLLEAARDLGASRTRTFLHVTLPLSKQAILAGSIIIMLPMFGDYYTNDLLSKSPTTSMVGNLIDQRLNSPQVTQAASLVVLLTLLLLLPMLYYLYATNRESRVRAA
jgi:spermidine/putrescine transport system permease protein